MNINQIPKPVLVALVLLAGVALIPLLSTPHSICDTQLKVLEENQAGFIYPKTEKKSQIPAAYERVYNSCYNSKVANSPGGCSAYFELIRKLVLDLRSVPKECSSQVKNTEPIFKALTQSLKVFVEIGWGDPPTEENPDFKLSTAWLELSDLEIFCGVRDEWIRFFGKEDLLEQKNAILKNLPGELKKYEVGEDGTRECLNCDYLKKAVDQFEESQIQSRSLFSVNCDRFR